MTGPYGIFSQEDARRIHNAVLGGGYKQPALDIARDKTIHNLLYYVVLKEDLPEATDPGTGYTQAEGQILRYTQPLSSTSFDMEMANADTKIKVTNRYVNFSALQNDLLLVIRNGSEWSPMTSGAPVSGAERIWFYIMDVHCPDAYSGPCDKLYVDVEWTDYTGGCGKEPPGVDPYTGLIKVYDRGILEYYTADQLINGSHYGPDGETLQGLMGSATLFYGRDGGQCDYGCEARWIIDSLLGNPECNDETVSDVGISS